MDSKKLSILFGTVIVLIAINFLAYTENIPGRLEMIPLYDSIGHFVLFGLLGLIAHYAFSFKNTDVFGRIVPMGPTIAIAVAMIDESLQVISINRTFDLTDLFFSIFGIVMFIGASWFIRTYKSLDFKSLTLDVVFFGLKELRAILFPLLFVFTLFISHYVHIPGLYRYDFLFIVAVAIQILLVVCKLETKDEAKTIFLFHIIGLALELFKTSPGVGSWSYPEPGILKIASVPLYSGFMYASVGSYIAHAWKVLKLRLTYPPAYAVSIILCFFIYLNFFTNHFIPDFRAFLFVAIFVVYYKTDIYFTPRKNEYHMPVIIGFLLTGFFVWIAENIGTFYGAWKYPNQIHEWNVVSLQKITSWFLLVIICFIVVSHLKHIKEEIFKKNHGSIFKKQREQEGKV